MYRPTVDKVVDGWECRYSDEASKFEGFGSLNKMTTAELLYQFFYYWGYRHNYKSSVVSMRVGDWLSKEEKGWTTRKQVRRQKTRKTLGALSSRQIQNQNENEKADPLSLSLRFVFDRVTTT